MSSRCTARRRAGVRSSRERECDDEDDALSGEGAFVDSVRQFDAAVGMRQSAGIAAHHGPVEISLLLGAAALAVKHSFFAMSLNTFVGNTYKHTRASFVLVRNSRKPPPFWLTMNDDEFRCGSGNILLRSCGLMLVTDPRSCNYKTREIPFGLHYIASQLRDA